MPAKLDISISNLKYNVQKIKEHIEANKKCDSNVEILAMVKADAYGAGMIEVAKTLESMGIKHLGVAYLKEAALLIKNNINCNIVVFSGLLKEEIDEAVKLNASYAISNIEIAKLINSKAKEINKKVRVHLAIDTGMGRIGVTKENINYAISELKKLEYVEIEGVFSHFSSADTDDVYTKNQNDIFNEALELLQKEGINYKYAHICNSVGIVKYPDSYNDIVRLGIGMYGYLDNLGLDLKGIFKLSAPISDIREINEGEAIGYSQTYKTKRKTKVATLQIGYADGMNRLLSNKFSININGNSAKIIGNICMDMTMIDVTDIDNINVGDYVTIFDFCDKKLNEISDICETIDYEVISTIGKRVDRNYLY